jgi:hypothetical protein
MTKRTAADMQAMVDLVNSESGAKWRAEHWDSGWSVSRGEYEVAACMKFGEAICYLKAIYRMMLWTDRHYIMNSRVKDKVRLADKLHEDLIESGKVIDGLHREIYGLSNQVKQLEKERDDLIDQVITQHLALDEFPSQSDLHNKLYKHPFFTPEGKALVNEWTSMLIDCANLRQTVIPPVDMRLLDSGDAGKMAGVLSRYLPTIQWILLQRKEQNVLQATPWPVRK